jgi:hypothetical protein
MTISTTTAAALLGITRRGVLKALLRGKLSGRPPHSQGNDSSGWQTTKKACKEYKKTWGRKR